SIALGRAVLDLPDKATTEKPLSLDESQACAAVGQIRLAQAYEQALQPLNLKTAQVLLTLEDGITRRRYLNSRATMLRLLDYGVVPIINENDTVATDEIRYGDNDRLAAQVAAMISADLLVLLSDVDGFYTANPRADNSAEHIARVGVITKEMESMATDSHNLSAKGGMRTKIIAAKTAMAAGCDMVIMKGDGLRPVQALQNGARHTLFCATDNPQQARKNWIAGMKTCGEIVIDDGARRAIGQGKSLLPAGVVRVEGSFSRGDVVAILDETGRALAKGLVCYDSAEVQVIAGHQTHKIKDLLGYNRRNVLVHRDDMIIL
ncbi:MAG: glutamate 5-kinase, partial [Proteobacteria bacterium]|nr:glutamate 5-kinase [Pseudomonadota bacterium]